jgi:amino acid transporter
MINSIIGSGIFGVPGELLRLLGSASPLAFLLAGLTIGVIVACFVEVGSQFSGAGGPYLSLAPIYWDA